LHVRAAVGSLPAWVGHGLAQFCHGAEAIRTRVACSDKYGWTVRDLGGGTGSRTCPAAAAVAGSARTIARAHDPASRRTCRSRRRSSCVAKRVSSRSCSSYSAADTPRFHASMARVIAAIPASCMSAAAEAADITTTRRSVRRAGGCKGCLCCVFPRGRGRRRSPRRLALREGAGADPYRELAGDYVRTERRKKKKNTKSLSGGCWLFVARHLERSFPDGALGIATRRRVCPASMCSRRSGATQDRGDRLVPRSPPLAEARRWSVRCRALARLDLVAATARPWPKVLSLLVGGGGRLDGLALGDLSWRAADSVNVLSRGSCLERPPSKRLPLLTGGRRATPPEAHDTLSATIADGATTCGCVAVSIRESAAVRCRALAWGGPA